MVLIRTEISVSMTNTPVLTCIFTVCAAPACSGLLEGRTGAGAAPLATANQVRAQMQHGACIWYGDLSAGGRAGAAKPASTSGTGQPVKMTRQAGKQNRTLLTAALLWPAFELHPLGPQPLPPCTLFALVRPHCPVNIPNLSHHCCTLSFTRPDIQLLVGTLLAAAAGCCSEATGPVRANCHKSFRPWLNRDRDKERQRQGMQMRQRQKTTFCLRTRA